MAKECGTFRGQFAIALWDERRQQLHLGRDRFGIAPLFWSRQGDWLLFASEIKGLLASGMVRHVRTGKASIMSSPFRQSPDREPVLKEFDFCHPATASASCQETTAQVR
jgi:asparagine synthetase B (glutamine-hydrolysing)